MTEVTTETSSKSWVPWFPFLQKSAFCEMPDPVCHAQSILMGKGVLGKDEDVGQGECNRDPRTGQAGQIQACAEAASQALVKF